MLSKSLLLCIAFLGTFAAVGCSGGGGDAKTGVKINPGDYAHAPGGGAKPSNPAAAPG